MPQFEDEFPGRGRGFGHFQTLIRKCPCYLIPRLIQAVNQSTLSRAGSHLVNIENNNKFLFATYILD